MRSYPVKKNRIGSANSEIFQKKKKNRQMGILSLIYKDPGYNMDDGVLLI